MPTYRTNGAWGSGSGVNLTPAQVDNNFYELRTDLDDVIANPPTADGLDSVTQSGFYLTFHTTLGNELGPIAIPVVYTVWRGDWAPFTLYSAADIFRVVDEGIFSVLQGHTSAATFDPDAAGGSPLAPYYNELIGVSTLPTDTSLDELNDVTITGVADGDLIAWDDGLSQWTNRTPDDVLALLAPTLDDLTDVIAPSPAVGQILRYLGGSPDKGWQPDTLSLDDLDDVSVPAPSDGYLLTYQAGSPTGWIAAPPPVLPTELDDLTDVIAPSPSDGDLLQFDGADWISASGMSVSGLDDAFLPLVGSDLFEVSQSSGSPPGSPPVGYESRKATLAHILAAGGFTLGSTAIALGGTTTAVVDLQMVGLTGASLSGPSVEVKLAGDTIARVAMGLSTLDTPRFSMGPGGAAARDLFLQRAGSANLRHGGVDAAAAIAQTISVQNVVAGTSNTAGADLTITGSRGTGTGIGGSIIFQTAPAGGSGSSQNALATALTINTAGFTGVFSGGTLSGNTTLPGSGQLNSSGALGLGATPAVGTLFVQSSNSSAYASNTMSTGTREYITNGDSTVGNLARLVYAAYDTGGPTLRNAAAITAIFTAKGASSVSADLVTQVSNAGTVTERSRHYSGGDFRQGTGSALATSATDGLFLLSTCAGLPTGVPTNAGAGQIPMVFNKTANVPHYYNAAWLAGVSETAAGTLNFAHTLGNGAAAAAGTLGNAPAAGNPTKWIPFNDNGTTRYVPAW